MRRFALNLPPSRNFGWESVHQRLIFFSILLSAGEGRSLVWRELRKSKIRHGNELVLRRRANFFACHENEEARGHAKDSEKLGHPRTDNRDSLMFRVCRKISAGPDRRLRHGGRHQGPATLARTARFETVPNQDGTRLAPTFAARAFLGTAGASAKRICPPARSQPSLASQLRGWLTGVRFGGPFGYPCPAHRTTGPSCGGRSRRAREGASESSAARRRSPRASHAATARDGGGTGRSRRARGASRHG